MKLVKGGIQKKGFCQAKDIKFFNALLQEMLIHTIKFGSTRYIRVEGGGSGKVSFLIR